MADRGEDWWRIEGRGRGERGGAAQKKVCGDTNHQLWPLRYRTIPFPPSPGNFHF